jgi:hypothetical protein
MPDADLERFRKEEDEDFLEQVRKIELGMDMCSATENEVGFVLGVLSDAEKIIHKIRGALKQRGHLYTEIERMVIIEAMKTVFALDSKCMEARHDDEPVEPL